MDLIDAIAKAIATMEGFYKAGTLAARNNNPGNLRSWGDTPMHGGFAVFATPEAGWEALRQQIRKNVARGLTLREFFGGKPGVYPGYAPAADRNHPEAYASFVAGRAGIPDDQPIQHYLNREPAPAAPPRPRLELTDAELRQVVKVTIDEDRLLAILAERGLVKA